MSGQEIVDNIKIFRGFKVGYTISDTRGLGINDGGNGGGGATGGDGGVNGSGGGGGSGYSNGTFAPPGVEKRWKQHDKLFHDI